MPTIASDFGGLGNYCIFMYAAMFVAAFIPGFACAALLFIFSRHKSDWWAGVPITAFGFAILWNVLM